MTSSPILNALRRVELFEALSPLQLSEIGRNAERLMYRDGDEIAAAGSSASGAILIVDGEVEQAWARSKRTETLVAGTLIAELAMFSEFEHGATFVAKGPVKALRIGREAIVQQIEEDQALADIFVSTVSARLREIASGLVEVDKVSASASDKDKAAA